MKRQFLCALTILWALTNSLSAATFTVINTNASGAGSLQQAILDANASAGADVIAFNIPSGGLTIAPTNALPSITEPVTIDGSTQPGFVSVPIIELNGASAGAAVDGLKIATSNSIIRALVINRFLGDGIEITNGVNNTIEGCYLGLNLAGLTDQGNTLNGILLTNAANNTIGGLEVTNRNYIAGNNQSGVHLGGAVTTNNFLLGNFIGLNTNNAAIANSVDGVRVNAPLNVIGGGNSGARNIISGNTGQGIEITALGPDTIIRGNYIGTDNTGTLDRGNTIDGILASVGGVIIGGTNAGEGNLISGNNGDGIELNGVSAINNLVLGNIIGANLSATATLANSGNGVLITTSSRSNIIGGVLAGQANVIAFNGANGINVAALAANTNNTFRGNSIFSNVSLGIDLGAAGITANDAGDTDTGANQLQNFPILTAATNTPGGTTITGAIRSQATTTYALDFYSSVAPDALGSGEGQTYLGSTNLTTDGSGHHNFTVSLPVVTLAGRYISATATDNFGNTSEFATNILAVSTVAGQIFTVVNTNNSGAGSLRQAIIDANAAITAGDTIQFAITNLTTTISPASALPTIIDPVTIDGYTQSGAAVNTSPTAFNGVLPVRLSGTSAGAGVNGLLITAGNSTVRGLLITGFTSDGIELSGFGANVIEGNVIGLTAAGVDAGNTVNGVFVNGCTSNLIGGTALAARNVISGNNGNGIALSGGIPANNQVLNNLIGVDQTGTLSRGNNTHGVFITSNSSGNLVGGLVAGAANLIAFNGVNGINVAAAVANTNNTFRGNSIFSNVGLGIDLGAAGITANDATDADSGANQLQNFPVLSAVTNTPAGTIIVGTINSRPSTTYALDFYSSVAPDALGSGEGQTYLGSTNLTTDGSGNHNFTVSLPVVTLAGRYISATATDNFGNTSEFATNLLAVSLEPGQTFTVVNTNDSGVGSLRQAIIDANAAITAGDTIQFAITNLTTTISPASALPAIVDPVTIDGYTQPGAAVNTSPTAFNGVLPVRLSGTSAGTGANGLLIVAGNSIVRGLLITGFNGDGIELSGFGANVIEGNVIGLTAAGVDTGNNVNGVFINGSPNNLIGGSALAARNVISGNTQNGIELVGGLADNNQVLNNLIGVDQTGVLNRGNTQNGVLINTRSNLIGGLVTGHANRIAFNGQDGISVVTGLANSLRGNAIFSNGGLGIDLGASGVTLNDANDVDPGANLLQNFPVLTSVTTNSSTQVDVTGSLASAASTVYAVDFYANAALDSSGHGEGQFYLGSTNLTTDGSGQVNFAVSLAAALPGRYVSATATDPNGNTSEFARWVVAVDSAPPTNSGLLTADFVFIIDASVSMAGEIAAVKNGLGSFVTGLNTNNIDARFAIVLFGGPTEVILDFTSDQLTTEGVFDLISVNGALPGIHNNHNLNPEAGLEAIRIVLNAAANSTIQRNHVGGTGPLAFRPEARKNLILVTDENSDLPYYVENRQAGQTGTEPPGTLTAAWQAEVDVTAQAVITNNAFVNLLISPTATPSRNQYGDPAQSVSDANFLNFDPDATLANLIAAGYGTSLEAQVLSAGLVGRAFNITAVDTANFVANFFAAKVEEIVNNQPPRPRLNIALIPSAVRLTWPTNSFGYLLETNHALPLTNGWGVLTTNYSVIGTNYAVTNVVDDVQRFYRLRK